MAEFFPDAERLRTRAREAAVTRTEWRSENVAMAGEFLQKVMAAGITTDGITRRLQPVYDAHGSQGLTTWEHYQLMHAKWEFKPVGCWRLSCLGTCRGAGIYLAPGNPPHWASGPVSAVKRWSLDELPILSSLSPETLHNELMALLEYAS
jgi:hypothetical protein